MSTAGFKPSGYDDECNCYVCKAWRKSQGENQDEELLLDKPVIGEADPELEKLLMEEEMIEKKTKGVFFEPLDKSEPLDTDKIAGYKPTFIVLDEFGTPEKIPEQLGKPMPSFTPPSDFARKHQTAVIFECPVTLNDNYVERLHRIAGSYGHEQTAKADRFVLVGHYMFKYTPKLKIPALVWDYPLTEKALITEAADWARKMQYTIIMFSLLPGREIE